MKILSHKIDEKNHVYKFVVTPDEGIWKKEFQKTINRLSKQVKLKGYRPGKVPPNIAIRYLNQQAIIRETAPKVVNPIYKQLLENKTVQDQNIIEDSYRISIDKVNPDDIELTYSFDLIPKVTIKNYKDIKNISLKKQSVTDAEVDKSLKELVGKEKNDDKFVKNLKIKDINSVDELKKYQKQILLWQKEEKEFLRVRNLLGKEIVKRTTIDYIPADILRQEESMLFQQYSTNRNGARDVMNDLLKDDPKSEKLSLQEKIHKMAEYTVTLSLALDKIMEENKLQLTDSDKKAYYDKLAYSGRISLDEAKKKLSNAQDEAMMQNEKVFKAIIAMNNK